ncbi:MAG: hypothetical protein ACJAYE_003457 [Candidatus Azotimanducaceae bacterium]|jgi:hypothetical protein
MRQDSTRNHWPLVLFSIPFAAVLFGIVMVSTVNYFPDDVVVDSYYKEGMAINQRIEADNKAALLNVSALIETSVSSEPTIRIDGATDSAISLHMRHVTDERLDKSYTLLTERGSDYAVGRYSGHTELSSIMSSTGIWYLELEGLDGGWRLRKRLVTPVARIRVDANE